MERNRVDTRRISATTEAIAYESILQLTSETGHQVWIYGLGWMCGKVGFYEIALRLFVKRGFLDGNFILRIGSTQVVIVRAECLQRCDPL